MAIPPLLVTLRRILLRAQAQELVPSNFVADWKALRGRRHGTGIRPLPRERVLTATKLEGLLAAASGSAPGAFPLVLFLADTGGTRHVSHYQRAEINLRY